MAPEIRQIVRKVVRVVAPGSRPAERPMPGANDPEPRERVLDHVVGIDRAEYGSPDFPACRDERAFTVDVDGRTHKIFFLVGHPRSGTHWMDAVLNCHPRAMIRGEYRFESLRNAFDDLTGKGWHAASREPMRSEAERCFAESVRRIVGASSRRKPEAVWLGDRTPRLLKVFLAGAPHFLIIRDPRDVLVSWAHQEIRNAGFNYRTFGFQNELGAIREQFVADPEFFKKSPERLFASERWVRHLVRRWRNHMRFDLAMLKAIDSGEVQARVRVVRYERIHADPELQRAAMYRFLDLEPREAAPLSAENASRPGLSRENPHGVLRKGAVGEWERYFTPQARDWFKDVGGRTLIELGYAKDDNW